MNYGQKISCVVLGLFLFLFAGCGGENSDGNNMEVAGSDSISTQSWAVMSAVGELTGTSIVEGVLAEQGAIITDSAHIALANRVQQMIDAGTDSNLQIAMVLAANQQIRTTVTAGQNPALKLAEVVGEVKTALSGDSGVVPFQTISTGAQHTCAVADNGQVWCWGSNSHGQSGMDTGFPAVTSPHKIDGIANAVDVSAHGSMSCAVRATGGVECWGNNQFGLLGIGYASPGAHVLPAPVVGISDAVAVRADAYSSGPNITCVQHAGGGVSCWGVNANLGDGIDYRERTDYDIKNPVRSLLSDVAELSVGYGYVCGRLSDGGVSCWGVNSSGQTGQPAGFEGNLTTPMRTDWVNNVVELEVGGATSCVRTGDGKVWCWGGNTYGSVGNGTTGAAVTVPAEISALNGARQLSLGWHFGCAVTSDAKARCWGLNSSGQLGDGTTINRSSPAEVVGLTDVVEVSAGLWHSCARRADGSVWCWGYNGDGQLGDGGRGNSLTPVQVSVLNLGAHQ